MSDTPMTLAQLIAALADNVTGNITAQVIRNLLVTVLPGLATFTDGTARAANVPAALNQLGLQLDTSPPTLWRATGTAAGNWQQLPTAGTNGTNGQHAVTFANDAARAAATPAFIGQIGFQIDTTTLYHATVTTAGGWADGFSLAGALNMAGNDVSNVRTVALTAQGSDPGNNNSLWTDGSHVFFRDGSGSVSTLAFA